MNDRKNKGNEDVEIESENSVSTDPHQSIGEKQKLTSTLFPIHENKQKKKKITTNSSFVFLDFSIEKQKKISIGSFAERRK